MGLHIKLIEVLVQALIEIVGELALIGLVIQESKTRFKLENPGIMTSALERYKSLSRQELEVINDLTGKLYERVLDAADSIP